MDIEAGHVNCVIVKDLSRLGRNTIDTGYYIEQYFRIRFIAVNENFDTANPEDAHSGIIIPLRNMINEAYALDIGRKITHENLLGSGKWQTRTVSVILRSEVYTGDLIQGQTKTVDHRQVKADVEEWTVVRDTHEAIISREQFAAVQEILNQTASRAKAREVKVYTPNLLKGKVFCAHCGGSLHRQRNIRKKSDDVYFYHCLSQSRISKDAYPGVAIREDALLDTQIEQHRALEQDAAQIKTDRALTGALIKRLIDRIKVSHDKQITVRYRFQSEFETYAEVLEQCRNM